MGYNPSKNAVTNIESVLDAMLKLEDSFQLNSSNPSRLIYSIHRAIKSIEAFPKTFAKYKSLTDKFTVKNMGDHVLFTRRKSLVEGEPIPVTPERLGEDRELCIESVSTPQQIVGAIIKHKAPAFRFPNAIHDDAALTKIYKWTSTSGYHLSLIDDILLVTRSTPLLEWTPQIQEQSTS